MLAGLRRSLAGNSARPDGDVMANELQLQVNGKSVMVTASPETPLLYVLTDELALRGPRFGCGLGQCGCCSVLADGVEIRSCITPTSRVVGKSVTTLEGLPAYYAARMKLKPAPELHPLQEAMITEQAAQCGYCYNGQIIKGAELLFKTPQPTEAQIRSAMNGHICRCGTYPRIMAAIQRAAQAIAARSGPRPRTTTEDGDPCLTPSDPSALARRDFLKTTGAVVVGLRRRRKGGRAGARRWSHSRAAGLVSGPPDPAQVDSYIAIHPDNTATLFAGYVELGQGGPTALRQVAAEELDLDLDQVKTSRPRHLRVHQRLHAASRTAGIGGTELRAAAAEARRVLWSWRRNG